MKNKLIIVLVVAIAVLAVGIFIFLSQNSATQPVGNANQQPAPSRVVNPAPAAPAQAPAANFEANDNLDQALQDLDTVK